MASPGSPTPSADQVRSRWRAWGRRPRRDPPRVCSSRRPRAPASTASPTTRTVRAPSGRRSSPVSARTPSSSTVGRARPTVSSQAWWRGWAAWEAGRPSQGRGASPESKRSQAAVRSAARSSPVRRRLDTLVSAPRAARTCSKSGAAASGLASSPSMTTIRVPRAWLAVRASAFRGRRQRTVSRPTFLPRPRRWSTTSSTVSLAAPWTTSTSSAPLTSWAWTGSRRRPESMAQDSTQVSSSGATSVCQRASRAAAWTAAISGPCCEPWRRGRSRSCHRGRRRRSAPK